MIDSQKASARRLTKLKPLAALCLLVALGAVAVGANEWLRVPAPARPSAPAGAKKEVLPAAVVTVTPRGFEPVEVTGVGGRFFLSVENRSGARGLTLRLDPERGNRVREFTQPEDELDWTDELDLTPGVYTLTVAGHPEWACHITMSAR
jgi:hypothetical protein